MSRTPAARALLAGILSVGLSGSALAFGNSGSGSGLSPYAAETGNDRSAGVNNGNYRDPRLDPYIRAYGSRYEYAPYAPPPSAYPPRRRGPYYGYPY